MLQKNRFAIALTVLALAGSAQGLFSQSGSTGKQQVCTLTVDASGFRNSKGVAGGSVFTTPDGWPEKNDMAYADDDFPISGGKATLTFRLPPGKYSVVVLHDENNNHKLDRNVLGVPKEGFGFSNNPRVLFKAPSFDAALINVGCPVTTIHVRMIYK